MVRAHLPGFVTTFFNTTFGELLIETCAAAICTFTSHFLQEGKDSCEREAILISKKGLVSEQLPWEFQVGTTITIYLSKSSNNRFPNVAASDFLIILSVLYPFRGRWCY